MLTCTGALHAACPAPNHRSASLCLCAQKPDWQDTLWRREQTFLPDCLRVHLFQPVSQGVRAGQQHHPTGPGTSVVGPRCCRVCSAHSKLCTQALHAIADTACITPRKDKLSPYFEAAPARCIAVMSVTESYKAIDAALKGWCKALQRVSVAQRARTQLLVTYAHTRTFRSGQALSILSPFPPIRSAALFSMATHHSYCKRLSSRSQACMNHHITD